MIEYRVEISDPGLCVNNPTVIIEKALKEAGFVVEVENEFLPESVEERLEFVTNDKNPGKIKLKVEHWPWGG